MKKLKKQSSLKVLATTSTLIGVCYIGTGLNTKIASASPNKVPTVNASTQTTNPSFSSKALNTLKKPFSATSKFFGRTLDSLKNCFGFKSSSSKKNESFEVKQNESSIVYADLSFEGNSNSNVRPRTEPETIYAQIKQDPTTSKKITVKVDVHSTTSNNPPLPASTQKPSPTKTGIDNQGFDNENSPSDEIANKKPIPAPRTKLSTNLDVGVNKKPIPAPRTKSLVKKVTFSPIVDRVTIREEGTREVMYSMITKLNDKS